MSHAQTRLASTLLSHTLHPAAAYFADIAEALSRVSWTKTLAVTLSNPYVKAGLILLSIYILLSTQTVYAAGTGDPIGLQGFADTIRDIKQSTTVNFVVAILILAMAVYALAKGGGVVALVSSILLGVLWVNLIHIADAIAKL